MSDEPVIGYAVNVSGGLIRATTATAYTLGKIMAQSATAALCSAAPLQVARQNGFTGMMRRFRLSIADTTFLNAVVRAHFFNAPPVFTNGDGANWLGGLSMAGYMGSTDITLDQQFTDPAVMGISAPNAGSEINFATLAASNAVYAALEARSTTAGGHSTAGSQITLIAETLRN